MVPDGADAVIYLVILGKAMGETCTICPWRSSTWIAGRPPPPCTTLQTLAARSRLVRVANEPDPSTAVGRLRQGVYKAVVILPADFSADSSRRGGAHRRGRRQHRQHVGQRARGECAAPLAESRARPRSARATAAAPMARRGASRIDVQRVDAYGHKEFMQLLVPAVIALALFFVAMLAGGIILVDDRGARDPRGLLRHAAQCARPGGWPDVVRHHAVDDRRHDRAGVVDPARRNPHSSAD